MDGDGDGYGSSSLSIAVYILIGWELWMLLSNRAFQKKRVTTGEMVVGAAKALFMDEISTALDSATTYQIAQCLRHYVQVFMSTMLVSLLQPAPETFDLFDDVILLSEGHVIYQGCRENILEFFESMGFK